MAVGPALSVPTPAPTQERVDVAIIGGGQAGLATAYWLQRLAPGLAVLVLDGGDRIGDSWRQRWESLQLFTPRAYSALPGLAFPDGPTETPDRWEMADYLQAYAARFALPVRLGARVQRVEPGAAGGFVVATSGGALRTRQVVVASGPFHDPVVPPAAAGLTVPHLHSYDYHRPSDLPGERVAVVGGGNSAAQLALELRAERTVTVVSPKPLWFVPDHVLGISSYHWMRYLGILRAGAQGTLARWLRRRGDAVFGTQLRAPLGRGELTTRASRVAAGDGDQLLLRDGSRLTVDAVLWCTGFHSTYPWLAVPGALDAAGNPVHQRGASLADGLHWMGLPWLTAVDSSIVHGCGPDARLTAERILAQSGLRPIGRAP